MPELKTNTVKHVYSVSISSETESFQTVVTAESMSEALRIVAEQRKGLGRRFPPVWADALGGPPDAAGGPQNTAAAL